MSPAIIFQIHLVLGYLPWLLCFSAYVWPKLRTMDAVAAQRAGSRLFVQESVYEPLLDKLKARLSTLRVGDPLDKNTDVGAINSATQLAKIQELVESGVQEGAEIFQPDCELPTRGYFFRPTLFTSVSQSHRIAQEEIFGPVLSVIRVESFEEAMAAANASAFGLTSSIYTRDAVRMFRYIDEIETGMTHVNSPTLGGEAQLPFGGTKATGVGPREQGSEVFDFYTETKVVYIDYTGTKREGKLY